MRRAGLSSLLVLAATAVALLLGELLIRLILPPLPSVEIRQDPEAEARRRAEREEGRVFEAETSAIAGLYVYTETGLRLRANTIADVRHDHVSGRSVQIRTNSLGYRNRELGPKERPRVLFLGDSITIAGYVDEEETFVRVVERLSEAGPVAYETVNAGVGGIGIEDELAILLETGLRTDPDVVVLCFYLNDAIPSPGVRLLPPPSWLERSRLVGYFLLAAAHLRDRDAIGVGEWPGVEAADPDAWLEQVKRDFPGAGGDLRRDRGAFNLAIEKNFRDWGCAWSEGAWRRMEPVLKEFGRQAGMHRFRLQVACFPVRPQVEAEYIADEPQRTLARLTAELDIPFLDLLPVLRAAQREGGEPLYYDQCHPTPRGNQIVARAILEFLWSEEGASS
jgi:lysophospholipase L1-like esterase